MGRFANMTSHSQASQDLFAYAMTEGKTDGFFVDLGCNHASFHSNSYALEQLGWTGLLVDIESGCESRKGTFIKCDAANPNEQLALHYSQLPAVCDFLSLDTDQAMLGTINALPWDKVTFRCICLETDVYRLGPAIRDRTRSLLRAMGYDLLCGDVMVRYPENEPPKPFEDWWIFAPLINPELISKYRCSMKEGKEIMAT